MYFLGSIFLHMKARKLWQNLPKSLKFSQHFSIFPKISPHDNFFSTNIIWDICDKYELWVRVAHSFDLWLRYWWSGWVKLRIFGEYVFLLGRRFLRANSYFGFVLTDKRLGSHASSGAQNPPHTATHWAWVVNNLFYIHVLLVFWIILNRWKVLLWYW